MSDKKRLVCPKTYSTAENDFGSYCVEESCAFWSKNLKGCSILKQAEAMAEIAYYLSVKG